MLVTIYENGQRYTVKEEEIYEPFPEGKEKEIKDETKSDTKRKDNEHDEE